MDIEAIAFLIVGGIAGHYVVANWRRTGRLI